MDVFFPIIAFVVAILCFRSFGINQEYQRGVVFRLGRLAKTKGPGWFWLIPITDRVVKVDLRTVHLPLPRRKPLPATAWR